MQTKENYYYLSSAFLFYLCSIKSYPLKHNMKNSEIRTIAILLTPAILPIDLF